MTQDLAKQGLPPRIPGLEKLGIFNGYENGRNIYAEKGSGQCLLLVRNRYQRT